MRKNWLGAALCAVTLCATAALAERDTFGLGTGQDGALTVPTSSTVTVNRYAQVTAPLAAGDISIPVGSVTGFEVGDLVMVLQTTGIVPTQLSGNQDPLPIGDKEVGRWELARLASVSGLALGLTAPLVHNYAANVTQVIFVPEYTTVTLATTSSRMTAQPWNGSTGGVIAFLATGAVTNAGQISAGAVGFRGGAYVNDDNDTLGCSGLDDPAPLGAQKGEGIDITRYGVAQTGRGNVANGGGGGVCYKAGGGGGGNAGTGGRGGNTDAADGSRSVGGLGGTALVYSMLDHLTLGGGGGAGQGADGTGAPGGRGGGAIFIRASQLSGNGSIVATGGGGGSASTDGASGGGAGGSISLRLTGTASCATPASISANGGLGGGVNSTDIGPGGGGGGGRILFQSSGGTCNPVASSSTIGANPGSQQNPSAPGGINYGAQAGSNGIVTRLTGGLILPTVSIAAPLNGAVINTRRPVITGASQAGNTVILYLDGAELTRVTADASGTYSYTPTVDLLEGQRTVRAIAEREGLQSPPATTTFTVDVTPPPIPVVQTPANGAFVNTVTPTLSGTAEPNSTVTVTLDGNLVVTTTADASGKWTVTSPVLSQGQHTVQATARDVAGNTSPVSNTNTFTVDTVAPDTSIVSGPTGAVRDTSATFDFASPEAGVTYECSLDGAAFAACSDPATFTGLSEGDHTLAVRARDAAGNVDPSPATRTWTVDLTPPAIPVVLSPANGAQVNTATPVISGTATPGSTVTVFIDGTNVGTAPVSDSGSWTFTSPTLGEGAHTVNATATDPAGNTSPVSNTNTFTVDTVVPDTSIVSGPTGTVRDTSATFDFASPEAGVTYECSLDGAAFAACGDPATFTGLSEGDHTLAVRARDAAGNVDPSPATRTWTVDLTPPAIPVVLSPANGAQVNTATPVISGTAAPGSTVTVFIDGTNVGTAPVSASGSWTFPSPTLGEGAHTVNATASDPAGNTSAVSNTNTFTVDTLPPAAPVVSLPTEGDVVGTATPVISGTAAPGSTVTVFIDGTQVGTTTADSSGNWTFTSPALADGPHTVTATATDVAGNTSPASAPRTFTVDTEPPDTSIVSGPEGTVNDTSATFDFGSTEAGVTYECSLDGGAFTACGDPATFTGLADGEHTLRVRARDVTGKVDPTPASRTWTVDTTAPAVPVIASPANGALVGGTPIFSGTAEPGSTVTVLVDGVVVGTTTANAEGNWTFTPTVPLSEGPHTVTVTATDAAGNTSAPSTGTAITVDTTAPDTSIVSGPEGTVRETSATFDFGSTEENVTYECSLDGAAFTACTDPVTWTGLAEGEHTLRVRARDAAGNVDETPASRTWTVAAGEAPDGGTGDGGTGDGGTGGDEDREFRGGGCGCSAEGGSPSLALLGLGALLALVLRRRRA